MKHAALSMRDFVYIVVTQAHCGRRQDEIAAFLVARGWPERSAQRFVSDVLSGRQAQPGVANRKHRTFTSKLRNLFHHHGDRL